MNRALRVWVAVVVLCSVPFLGQSSPPLPDSPGDSRANPHLFSSPEPDRVRLSEILISTPQPYDPDQVAEARHKAEELRDAIRGGSVFADVAKTNSQGPSASLGGDLGYFRQGAMAPSLDELVFRMKVGDVSDVLRTKQGFVILQVTQRDALGGGALGALDILSDTQGVDFGPYLQRILANVRQNWYFLIPESASKKKGKVAIEFAITKDGQVAGMKLVVSSGDMQLDRAAWGSIVNSNPFPALPSTFGGPHIALRFRFFYNPERSDLPDSGTVAATKLSVQVRIWPARDMEVPAGGSVAITTTVTGAINGSVGWTLTGEGCSSSACGEMTGNLYTAPSVLPNPALVTLTATSKADPNAKASIKIHIVQPSPSH